MAARYFMETRIRTSGVLIILGLLVEALCLVWSRPIAFLVLAFVGGALIGFGVLLFLYSLVSGARSIGDSHRTTGNGG